MEPYLEVRERLYGIKWNEAESSLQKNQGARDGSIDRWIEVLQLISSLDAVDSGFLGALSKFLNGTRDDQCRINLDPFIEAWRRACDLSLKLPKNARVIDALWAVNSFRNRLAHVPFPYDRLKDVCSALEDSVFALVQVGVSLPQVESPLYGGFAVKGSILRGAGSDKVPRDWCSREHESFVWGAKREEVWDARPFVNVDKMMRAYVLTRLKNEEGAWEYTRYLAEADAVFSLTDPDLLKCLPIPVLADYSKQSDSSTGANSGLPHTEERVIANRQDALNAVRERDFERAIEFLKNEAEKAPSYHSAWHRLGYAQREYGVDLANNDRDKADKMLRNSLESFTKAIGHTHRHQRSLAYYDRSKTHWRLWRLGESSEIDQALADAEKAAEVYYDAKFVSWYEFLVDNTRV